jgi:vacuolar protein sorting-associated protein 41
VVVTSLYTPEINTHGFKHSVTGVAFEPEYAKKQGRQFVAGCRGSLTMHGKGWFGSTQVLVHSGDGGIESLTWRGAYILWATDKVRGVDEGSSCL